MKIRRLGISVATLLSAAGLAQAQFTEGFDNIATLAGSGWVIQNNSVAGGTTTWMQGDASVFPAQTGAPTSYIFANYQNTSGTNTISNWLVTPVVALSNGASFTFYTRTVTAPAYPDRLQVRMNKNNSGANVGTLPTDVGDFTDLLLDINPTYTLTTTPPGGYPNVFTQITVTISGVAGTVNGRLALRYFVEGGGPTGLNSDYIGIDEAVYNAGGVVTGRCCMANGSCQAITSSACGTAGGIYGGDGTTCVPNTCPQPPSGACCAVTGCSVVTSAACTTAGGVYQGNVSACTGQCPTAPVLYSNCNVKTGPMTLSGVAAPAGAEWSECARDETDPTTANTTAGLGGTGALRLADDFVVPAGGMQVGYLRFYAYWTGASAPGVTAATLRILDGSPAGSPNVVFGDQTTNRLAGVAFSNIYRTFNTVTPAACGGTTTASSTARRLQQVYVAVNQFLPAGTYWVDYNYTGASFSPPSTQADAIGRQCNPGNANAMQFNAAWAAITDAGQGCAPSAVTQDMYFEVLGPMPTVSACYANCDGSTGTPVLTANDFQCFADAYASGSSTANCDGSTGTPTLTANDFQCFANAFAAGCS